MKMSKLLTVIAVVMALILAFAACGPKTPPDEAHQCESKCETCGKCTDTACTEDACKDKCQGHQPADVETTPEISVVPPALEIHACLVSGRHTPLNTVFKSQYRMPSLI